VFTHLAILCYLVFDLLFPFVHPPGMNPTLGGNALMPRRSLAPILMISVALLAGCSTTTDDRWRMFNDDGVQLYARGNYRDALDSFDYALTLRPQDPVLLYNAAQCYDRLGNVKKAEQYYAYCLERDRKHGDARLALVSLKYRTGRTAEANQQIQQWLTEEPNSAEALVADAWRLRQERAYPSAQARLQQALAIDAQNRPAQTELAIIHELQGMPDRSLVLYERILAREPNQVEIAERLEQLRVKGVKRAVPN
jgi:Tfp pilus assembly protein PilF